MNKDEFIAVITENKKLIYKICNSYCPDLEDRKDLEQEILIQLWQSFIKFDGRVKITTWMYKVALNTAISYYRKNTKQQKRHVSTDSTVISITETTYDHQTDKNIELLHQLISGLNKIDKALIIMYLDNVRQREIAEVLGITEANVSTKINRIKASFKKQMEARKI